MPDAVNSSRMPVAALARFSRLIFQRLSLSPAAVGSSITRAAAPSFSMRSEEHTSELQSLRHLVCRLLLEKKTNNCRFCKESRPAALGYPRSLQHAS